MKRTKVAIFVIVPILLLTLLLTVDTIRTNAQPPPSATLGANNFTGTQGVNTATGDAVVAVANNGRAVLGIGSKVGGQFETDDGYIFLGRGRGYDRITIDSVGTINTHGDLRVDKSVSIGGGDTVAVDAPGVAGGRLQINPAGDVSIGTATPHAGAKLTVNGNAHIDGKLGLGVNNVYSQQMTVSPGTVGKTHAQCPGGSMVVGGGFSIGGPGANFARPLASTFGQDSWIVHVLNDGGHSDPDLHFTAAAVCVGHLS